MQVQITFYLKKRFMENIKIVHIYLFYNSEYGKVDHKRKSREFKYKYTI